MTDRAPNETIWSDTDLFSYLANYVQGVRFLADLSCELYLPSGDVIHRPTLREACRDALAGADPNISLDDPTWRPELG